MARLTLLILALCAAAASAAGPEAILAFNSAAQQAVRDLGIQSQISTRVRSHEAEIQPEFGTAGMPARPHLPP